MKVCHVPDIEVGAFASIHPLHGGNAFGAHREELLRVEEKAASFLGEPNPVVRAIEQAHAETQRTMSI